jgi:uncharacterized membrane protein
VLVVPPAHTMGPSFFRLTSICIVLDEGTTVHLIVIGPLLPGSILLLPIPIGSALCAVASNSAKQEPHVIFFFLYLLVRHFAPLISAAQNRSSSC